MALPPAAVIKGINIILHCPRSATHSQLHSGKDSVRPWQQASKGTGIGFGKLGVQGMRKLSVSHHAKQLCEATKAVSADELSAAQLLSTD